MSDSLQYVEGFVAAVPTDNKQSYIEHVREAIPLFRDHGALRIVECWGDDVRDGEHTSFPMAVKCRDDETVVFSWIVWPSKEVRDKGMLGLHDDPRMQAMDFPFDAKRLIFGGFEVVVDEAL